MTFNTYSNANSLANGQKACGGEWRVLPMTGDGAEGQTRLMHGCRQATAGNAATTPDGMPASATIDCPQFIATIFTGHASDEVRHARQERAIRYGTHPWWMHAAPPVHGISMDGEERGTLKCRLERIGNTEHGLLPVKQSLPIEGAYRSGRLEDPSRRDQHAVAREMMSPLANCDSRQYEGVYNSVKERGQLQTVVSGTNISAATDKGSKTAHADTLPEVQ